MTWFKVDDGLHSHPKWLTASPPARALWVTAGSWSASHLTVGHIPRSALPVLSGRPRDADELVNVGLWEPLGDGWQFHSWDEFQPSSESVEQERAAARERQRRARNKARTSRRDKPVTDTASHGPPRHGPPDPTRPDPSTSRGETTPTTALNGAPPRKCPAHQNTDHPPPCGACADARRTHDTWQHQYPNGTKPDPTAAQQAAARARAEAGIAKVHDLVTEPPDPDAAQRAAELRAQFRLPTRKDTA